VIRDAQEPLVFKGEDHVVHGTVLRDIGIAIGFEDMTAYSGDCCHLIRRKAAIRSGVKLPPVPEEGCHPFQAKAATPSERSDAWFDQVTWTQFPLSMVQRVVCASILL
jgi:hypothetical protein